MTMTHSQGWHVGWIAGAIAVIALLLLLVDIVAHRSAQTVDGLLGTVTLSAAQAAGASVRPSETKAPRVSDQQS